MKSSDGLELEYAIGQEAADKWPEVSGLIEQVLTKTHGELSLDDFLAGFQACRYHLWLGYAEGELVSCMVTENVQYPQLKGFRVVVASGAGFNRFMRTYWDYVMDWAKFNGASFIEAWTSPAMTRYHRRFGAKKVYDIIRFPIEG